MNIVVTHFIENDTALVSVPLTNSDQSVTLYQETFNSLIAQGLDPRWKLQRMQILEKGSNVSVTRLAAGAEKGEKVRLIDRDPTNLRKDNIVVITSTTNSKEQLKQSRRHQFNPVTIQHEYINPNHIENIT
jgi:hypothetical protein